MFQAMAKQQVLITGASGLIGQILFPALAGEYVLHGLDRMPCTERRIIQADIAEYDHLERVLQQLPAIDRIVHLAADPHVDAPWESVLRNNIVGTRNVYETALRFSVPQIVFASSNHVTGAYERVPMPRPPLIHSDDPIAPDSDYGVSKACGEATARFYADVHGVRSICLRIGSVLSDDNPARHPRLRKLWLSHRDLVQLVTLSLRTDLRFGIFYGVSANRDALFDIADARRLLGYEPRDDASIFRTMAQGTATASV